MPGKLRVVLHTTHESGCECSGNAPIYGLGHPATNITSKGLAKHPYANLSSTNTASLLSVNDSPPQTQHGCHSCLSTNPVSGWRTVHAPAHIALKPTSSQGTAMYQSHGSSQALADRLTDFWMIAEESSWSSFDSVNRLARIFATSLPGCGPHALSSIAG